MSNLVERIAALKATGKGGTKKSSHPDVIHYLVEQLKSEKGEGGFSVAQLAEFFTERGYDLKKTQISGMIYSESAEKSHSRAVARFQELIEAGDADAIAEVEKYLPANEQAAAA